MRGRANNWLGRIQLSNKILIFENCMACCDAKGVQLQRDGPERADLIQQRRRFLITNNYLKTQ